MNEYVVPTIYIPHGIVGMLDFLMMFVHVRRTALHTYRKCAALHMHTHAETHRVEINQQNDDFDDYNSVAGF